MRKTAILAGVSLAMYAAFSAGFLSCFSPDFSTATILCSADKPDCPPGYVCQSSYCVPESTAQVDQSVNRADAATQDMAIPPPDMTRSGCASGGGYPVGKAWACPGRWGIPIASAQTLCDATRSYKVCKTIGSVISGVDLLTCRSLNGFYAIDLVGSHKLGVVQPNCTFSDPIRVLFGCGEPARATDFTTLCGGFGQAVDCSDNRSGIVCPGNPPGSIEQFTNSLGIDGVLCCPP